MNKQLIECLLNANYEELTAHQVRTQELKYGILLATPLDVLLGARSADSLSVTRVFELDRLDLAVNSVRWAVITEEYFIDIHHYLAPVPSIIRRQVPLTLTERSTAFLERVAMYTPMPDEMPGEFTMWLTHFDGCNLQWADEVLGVRLKIRHTGSLTTRIDWV